jgi:hypothetical protein
MTGAHIALLVVGGSLLYLAAAAALGRLRRGGR